MQLGHAIEEALTTAAAVAPRRESGGTSRPAPVLAPEQTLSRNWPGEINQPKNMEYVIIFSTATMIALYPHIIGRFRRVQVL